MPTNYIVRMFYRQYNRGWTENFWVTSGEDVMGLHDDFKRYVIGPALNSKDPSVVLDAISIHQEGGVRIGHTQTYNQSRGGQQGPPGNPDQVATAAVYRIGTTAGKSRSIWLRGLDDVLTVVDYQSGVPVQGALKTKCDAYLRAVWNRGWCVRFMKPVSGLGVTAWNIVLQFGPATNKTWTRVFVQDKSLLPQGGQIIRFNGLANPRDNYLKGLRTVMAVDQTGGTYDVNAEYRYGTGPVDCANTLWTLVQYDYSGVELPFGNFALEKHDTGRPISRHRGRRSPVTRAQLTRAG